MNTDLNQVDGAQVKKASQVIVNIERLNSSDGQWQFKTIPSPSRSDIACDATVTVAENRQALSCMSLRGLHNGVMPWGGYQLRDFFAFCSFNEDDGKILMDFGEIQPIAAVSAYSRQDNYPVSPDRATLFNVPDVVKTYGVNGGCAPQVYSLYGSAAKNPDPSNLSSGDWVRIADVDTRPNTTGDGWEGKHGSHVCAEGGALLGNYRWLLWEIKRTCKPGQPPAQSRQVKD